MSEPVRAVILSFYLPPRVRRLLFVPFGVSDNKKRQLSLSVGNLFNRKSSVDLPLTKTSNMKYGGTSILFDVV